jgi:hypothetical protein
MSDTEYHPHPHCVIHLVKNNRNIVLILKLKDKIYNIIHYFTLNVEEYVEDHIPSVTKIRPHPSFITRLEDNFNQVMLCKLDVLYS